MGVHCGDAPETPERSYDHQLLSVMEFADLCTFIERELKTCTPERSTELRELLRWRVFRAFQYPNNMWPVDEIDAMGKPLLALSDCKFLRAHYPEGQNAIASVDIAELFNTYAKLKRMHGIREDREKRIRREGYEAGRRAATVFFSTLLLLILSWLWLATGALANWRAYWGL